MPHQQFLQESRWGYLVVKIMCYIHMTSLVTSPSQSLSYSVGTNIDITWGSSYIVLTHPSFSFDLKDHQRSKIESVFGNFQNPCLAHDSFNFTLDMKRIRQIVQNEIILTTMTSSAVPQHDFEYCPLYSCLRDGGSEDKSKAIFLRNIANIIIIFLGCM